jgi:hypothetical protein
MTNAIKALLQMTSKMSLQPVPSLLSLVSKINYSLEFELLGK